jgi:hypothetical protein
MKEISFEEAHRLVVAGKTVSTTETRDERDGHLIIRYFIPERASLEAEDFDAFSDEHTWKGRK